MSEFAAPHRNECMDHSDHTMRWCTHGSLFDLFEKISCICNIGLINLLSELSCFLF